MRIKQTCKLIELIALSRAKPKAQNQLLQFAELIVSMWERIWMEGKRGQKERKIEYKSKIEKQ